MTFVIQFDENDIFRVLTDTPASAAAIAKKANCSVYTAKNLLMAMHAAGKVQRIEIETPRCMNFTWKRL